MMTVALRTATEESVVRLPTLTRQKFEYQLKPCNFACIDLADFQISKGHWKGKSYTELEIERRKVQVESRFELKYNKYNRIQLSYWNRRNNSKWWF